MGLHVIKKGLDLPIAGKPEQTIDTSKVCTRVAIMAHDYVGMRPTFLAQVGDAVKRGQALFEDKKTPGVIHTSPGAGTLVAIHRGERRALQSVVIELTEHERNGTTSGADVVSFAHYAGKDFTGVDRASAEALLLESGLWTCFRTRPFSKVPAPGSVPHSIFVTAMDTEPLAPPLEVIAAGREADLEAGLRVIGTLTDGKVIFCTARDSKLRPPAGLGVEVEEFAGPHPSGTVGLHIHLLDPVGRAKTVWHVGLQDVLAIGVLFKTGKLDVARTISVAGPGVRRPRLLRTRVGAYLDELLSGELEEGEQRVISGSVLSGRKAKGKDLGYLGRYHNQVSVIREGREREFMGWLTLGGDKFSVTGLFLSKLLRGKKFSFSTTTNGSDRAMVPIGLYEKVMPLDILPTFLLRSLIVKDLERAEALGCLELDEEDLSLCSFVCPGKHDFGPILRENLDLIEKEG